MTGQRFLYYTPWLIEDGSVIACGLGFNGYDVKTEKPLWDRIVNVNVL
jgi:hypothetical protein